jgi:hypothetical protein
MFHFKKCYFVTGCVNSQFLEEFEWTVFSKTISSLFVLWIHCFNVQYPAKKSEQRFFSKQPPINIAGNCFWLLTQIWGARKKAKGGKKETPSLQNKKNVNETRQAVLNSLRLTVNFWTSDKKTQKLPYFATKRGKLKGIALSHLSNNRQWA